MSSRHKSEIEELSHEKSRTELNLEKDVEDEISHAVKAYINHKIHDLIVQYDRTYGNTQDHEILVELQDVENEVAEELHKKADKTFLWVALVFEQIRVSDCDASEIPEFVHKMPVGLHGIYNKMMRQIIQRQDRYSNYCKEVLLIAVNSYRQLQLFEMAKLAALPKLASYQKVIQLCGLLSLREEDTVIYFVHQSAKDYLIQYVNADIISQLFPDGCAKGHLTILSRVLRRDIYKLEHPGFCIADVHPPLKDPLASIQYACVYWVDHLHEMGSHNGILLHDNGTVDDVVKKHLSSLAGSSKPYEEHAKQCVCHS